MFPRAPGERGPLTRPALLLAAVALATGCGSAAPEAGSSRPVGQPADRIVLPFDDYRLTAGDVAVIQAAEGELMRRCMERAGHGWTRPPARTAAGAAGDPGAASGGNDRRYGVADESTARRHGYHVPDDPREARDLKAQRSWLAALGPAEERTLLGEGGCADEAAARLSAGGAVPGAEWFTAYDFASVDASATAPPVRSAVSRWRTCMSERGFDYDTPLAAIEDRSWNLDAKRVTSREISVAVADVGCKRESDLVAVRAAAETGIQRDLIAREPGRFRELKRDLERYRHNADKALNGG
ncbi:hypothetical protein ABGB09_27125 [Streptomyces sp. B8F3]|uniref:hypothetical protein n=1 Tax=Streptomyces sp. B8F3 TaxID=3153573 RepID=UPI00325C5F09